MFQQLHFRSSFDHGETRIVKKTDLKKLRKNQLLSFKFRNFNRSVDFQLSGFLKKPKISHFSEKFSETNYLFQLRRETEIFLKKRPVNKKH